MFRRLVLALLGAVLITLIAKSAAGQPTQRELYALTANNTFKMLNPNNLGSGGTGFAVKAPSGKVYTITNAHVCGVSKVGYMLAMRGDRKVRVQILDVMDQADLCILEAVPNYEGLTVADRWYYREQVYVTGHPHLRPVTMTAGWILAREFITISYCEAFKYGYVWGQTVTKRDGISIGLDCIKEVDAVTINADSAPGNSGSSVINERGEVVGVLFGGGGLGGVIVPLNYLKDFLSIY